MGEIVAELILTEDNKLVCNADFLTGENKDLKFVYRLRCGGRIVVECTPKTFDKTITFDVVETGLYWAEVWVNIADAEKKETNGVFVFSDEMRMNYSNWRTKNEETVLPELGLYKSVYPFCDIAVIKTENASEELKEKIHNFAENNGFLVNYFKNVCLLSTQQLHQDKLGNLYVFSGVTRNKNALLVGSKDIQKFHSDIISLSENTGEFCLFYKKFRKFEMSSDFFGINRIFYHKSDNLFVAANSYHLTLLILKAIGVKMHFDEEKIKASFYDTSTFLESNFHWQMDIAQVKELPVDKRIIFFDGEKEIIFENTALYEELKNPASFDEKQYEDLLFKAKEEIIDNLKVTLEHPDFDYVRIDLTGGTDSRIVYGAATNLPASLTKKIRIRSEKHKEEDFKIANAINNLYKFPYDDLPVEYCAGDNEKELFAQNPNSCNLGIYFIGWNVRKIQRIADTIHISGGVGEVCMKPFWSYFYPNTTNADELFEKIFNVHKCNILCYPGGEKYLKKYISETLKYIPARTFFEKIENHYLYFRNGYHFSFKYYSDIIGAGWTPLQSKSCFRMRNMAWSVNIDMKPQYDLISIMNPIVSQFPYVSEKQNNEKKILKERLYKNGLPYANINFDNDVSLYEKAESAKIERTTYMQGKEHFLENMKMQTDFFEDEKVLLSALKNLLNYSEKFEDMGIYLYAWIVERGKKDFVRHNHNLFKTKLMSVYWQLTIIQDL